MSNDETPVEPAPDPEPDPPPASPPPDESPFDVQPLDDVQTSIDPPNVEMRDGD